MPRGAGADAPILLACGDSRALIDRRGAQPIAWSVGASDLLWAPDPAVWSRTAPILFPIVGRLADDRLRVGEFEARLGVHGFAASSLFEIEHAESDRARLVLRDDARTRSVYPFGFALIVEHRLEPNGLTTRLRVENRGDGDMPYACGLHPGFRWPFDGGAAGDYRIRFDAAERPLVPEIAGGLFAARSRALPLEDRMLRLDPDLLAREALCFLDARSRSLRFEAPSGRAILVETENFPHIALWSRPPAPFLCVESWTGHGDPVGFCGDLFAKPSMRILAPGAAAEHSAAYRFA